MPNEPNGGPIDATGRMQIVTRSEQQPSKIALRRVIDVIVALTVLILVSPVLLVLGLCSHLSTGGSAIFRQQRLGLGGLPFSMLKFRTLPPDAPCRANKLETEQLATRLGRLMRQLKLDELPQLWNILKGDMSLVGPRPIIPEEYRYGSHYDRLTVRPGLTGLWQLSPVRCERFDKHPEYDIFYLANRGFAFDLWLVWRTLLLIVADREIPLGLAVGRWERNPDWRTSVDQRVAGQLTFDLTLDEGTHPTAPAEGSRGMGANLVAGALEAIPASAPAE